MAKTYYTSLLENLTKSKISIKEIFFLQRAVIVMRPSFALFNPLVDYQN